MNARRNESAPAGLLTDVKKKAAHIIGEMRRLLAERSVQVTIATALLVACCLSIGLGLFGLILGTVNGLLIGIPLMIFTFGLSLPVCTVIGAAIGCAIGVCLGWSVGLFLGGLLGHFGYAKREAIRSAATCLVAKCRAWLTQEETHHMQEEPAEEAASEQEAYVDDVGSVGSTTCEDVDDAGIPRHDVCACGSIMLPESKFCHQCGARREVHEVDLKAMQAPVPKMTSTDALSSVNIMHSPYWYALRRRDVAGAGLLKREDDCANDCAMKEAVTAQTTALREAMTAQTVSCQ